MRRLSTIAVVLVLASWCGAGQAVWPPPEVPGPAGYDESNPMPRSMTPEEQLMPLPVVPREAFDQRTPPTGQVYCPPEYAPMAGLLIAWEGYTSILTQLTDSITNTDPTAMVWVVVDNSSEQTTAYNALNSAGADMSQVGFIVRLTDSVWIRDYGPRYIFEDGARAIVDHTYNRPSRPNDDAFNDYLATLWSEPQYDIPLTHGGGNFHLFSNGDAFMTTLITAENPGLSEQDVIDLYYEYQNVNLTIYPGFPTSFDSTRHIDMWMFPVGDNKVIIGQYASSSGQPYTITENATADLISRGYTVYRTPGWNSGGTHYTYTNAVVLNNHCYISRFNVSPQDAQALAVFQTAMPGYTIHQIDNSDIIQAAGAMHCIVMHVPVLGEEPTVTVGSPNGGEVWLVNEAHNITWTANDNVGVTGIDIFLSTDGGATWPLTIATGETNDGTYAWTVPNTVSAQCRVKLVAHDGDENTGEDTSNANFRITRPAEVVYSFPMDSSPGWSTQGNWAFGVPTGGGTHNGDPDTGHTGSNVYGYNLNGDYTNNMPVYYLTTAALDLSGWSDVQMRFWRWLGVESSTADHAIIQASTDGSAWTTVWEHTGSSVADLAWTQLIVNLSAVADDQPVVYIRWGMGTTNAITTYPGWNIDDVDIWGVSINGEPGDMDGDGDVDPADHAAFFDCLNGPEEPPAQPNCGPADIDGDDDVDAADFAGFQQAFTGA